MNAYFLHKPDGTPTGISVCGVCGQVAAAGNADISMKCCSCWECGGPLSGEERRSRSLYHFDCDRKRGERIETQLIEKAELVSDYDGPVFLEGVGNGSYGQGYFADVEELSQNIDFIEGRPRPLFAFCCESRSLGTLDIDSVLESHVSEAFEDAIDHLNGVDELAAAFDAFNAANANVLFWDCDYSRKVAIPAAVETPEETIPEVLP